MSAALVIPGKNLDKLPNEEVAMKVFCLFIVLMTSQISQAKNPISDDSIFEISGVSMGAHASELSILDSNIARDLFKRLPVSYAPADLVHGLLFKNDRHIFCVREPSRKYHCHFYLKDHGEGELSSYWKDHDYGQGNLMEYLQSKMKKGTAKLEIINNRLHIYTEGDIAEYLFERMDLSKVSYHKRDDGITYEKRIGRKMKCVRAEAQNKDIHACRVFIPIGPDQKDEEIPMPKIPLS